MPRRRARRGASGHAAHVETVPTPGDRSREALAVRNISAARGVSTFDQSIRIQEPAMFPANYPLIRAATADDAGVLRALAMADGRSPLRGSILVAERHGAVVAAISREDRRTIANRSITPAYVIARLRLHLAALEAYEREPDLGKRVREAVVGPRPAVDKPLPLAA